MNQFEFVVEGPPVSQQTRRRARYHEWKSFVAERARSAWPAGELPWSSEIEIVITHLYRGSPLDIDNIPKPILDAIKGIAYIDDVQVTAITCRRRNLDEFIGIDNPESALAALLNQGAESLHILVRSTFNHDLSSE